MTVSKRALVPVIEADLKRKMVFVAGPRQVGKTTLAKSLRGLGDGYRNWDVAEHRRQLLGGELPTSKLWAFDEVHKYHRWRNWLKGLWDGRREGQRILVTGSARLDFYRRGGDSLQGRYHLLRLHPLTFAELGMKSSAELAALVNLGGFPEPFFGGSERQARRWSREYRTRLVRDEVVDLERVQDLGSLELLLQRLPDLVGSLLSVNALREDLQTTHKTLSRWLDILERFYAIFRLAPFGTPRIRAIKKAQKHYHWDWSVVSAPGPRFENVIASHLLRWVHWQQDVEGRDYELRYFRDTDGREVDFVVVDRRQPVLLVECKVGDDQVDKNLRYLHAKFPKAPAWQVSLHGSKDYVTPEGIRVAPAVKLLATLS
ncbi:MAG: ATP-binding protein [Planctomycetes bacterium]|nr:ATP-binding protein [Planctomycetota bacterium]